MCDVALFDTQDGVEISLVKHGYVMREERGRVGSIETATGFASITLHGSETVLDVVGCEQFLNRPIEALPPGDGLLPGDYLRLLFQDAGLPLEVWHRIPSGQAAHLALGWHAIPPTRPGRYPHQKPTSGQTYLDVARGVVSSHCAGGELWNDGAGLRLDKFAARDRSELAYGAPETGVPVASPLCLRNRGGFKLTQDLRDYITSATFIGKKDPKTGLRVSETVSIPQASDERFQNSLFHIGHEIPFVAGADDSLGNKADCARAGRDHLHITPQTPDGLPPHFRGRGD